MTTTTQGSKRLFKLLCVLGLSTIASTAMAAQTWDFGSCGNTAANQTGSGTFGNSWSCGGVTVYGFGGGSGAAAGTYQTANVEPHGTSNGFGVNSQYEGINPSSPNHTMDNNPTGNAPELLLLKFNTAVALGTVTVGWSTNDSDMTIMAYKGALDLKTAIVGKNVSTLMGLAGWGLVQNVGDAAPDTAYGDSTTDRAYSFNSGNVVSSWWLISAYSSSFGAGTLDSLSDYVKVLSVASKDVSIPQGGQLPEPGTLAMAGVALLGLLGTRRHVRKSTP